MSRVNRFPGDLCLNHEKEHLQCKLHCWWSIYRQLNHFNFLDGLVICSYCFVGEEGAGGEYVHLQIRAEQMAKA